MIGDVYEPDDSQNYYLLYIDFCFYDRPWRTQEALGLPGVVILPQLAPGVGALLMVLIFRREGFRFHFGNLNNRRILLTILVPFGAAAIIYVLNFLSSG